ncbi:MAG: glycosyltransferase family 2 protein [Patescibacteria group bacterium]
MNLTVIIPAYNEEATVSAVLKKVLANRLTKEIIVVNDGSSDGTRHRIQDTGNRKVKIINKKRNEGKGAAIRDALKIATGNIFIIQDADLEYDPREYSKLIKPILENKADVVYGSRFMGSDAHRVLYFWHMLGNKFLTLLTNIATNLNLTDMETCYKVFTKQVSLKLNIKENRFGFEPEFTIKVAQMGFRIYEVGIGYSGRSYIEGKKINWRDGIWAIWCILKYSLYVWNRR